MEIIFNYLTSYFSTVSNNPFCKKNAVSNKSNENKKLFLSFIISQACNLNCPCEVVFAFQVQRHYYFWGRRNNRCTQVENTLRESRKFLELFIDGGTNRLGYLNREGIIKVWGFLTFCQKVFENLH